jgi:hypothetical protein
MASPKNQQDPPAGTPPASNPPADAPPQSDPQLSTTQPTQRTDEATNPALTPTAAGAALPPPNTQGVVLVDPNFKPTMLRLGNPEDPNRVFTYAGQHWSGEVECTSQQMLNDLTAALRRVEAAEAAASPINPAPPLPGVTPRVIP